MKNLDETFHILSASSSYSGRSYALSAAAADVNGHAFFTATAAGDFKKIGNKKCS
jgi:hypothetical protein